MDFIPLEVLDIMPHRNSFLTERGIHYYDKLVVALGLEYDLGRHGIGDMLRNPFSNVCSFHSLKSSEKLKNILESIYAKIKNNNKQSLSIVICDYDGPSN